MAQWVDCHLGTSAGAPAPASTRRAQPMGKVPFNEWLHQNSEAPPPPRLSLVRNEKIISGAFKVLNSIHGV